MEPDAPPHVVAGLVQLFEVMGMDANLVRALMPSDPLTGAGNTSSRFWGLSNGESTPTDLSRMPPEHNEMVCEIINMLQEWGIYSVYIHVVADSGPLDAHIEDLAGRGDHPEGHASVAGFLMYRQHAILSRLFEHRYSADNHPEEQPLVGISGHWLWDMGNDVVRRIAYAPPWYKPLVTTKDIAMRETRLWFPTDEIMGHFVNVFQTVLLIGEDNVLLVEDVDGRVLRIIHKTTYSPQDTVLQELWTQRMGADWCMFNDLWVAHMTVHGLGLGDNALSGEQTLPTV
jgi:hypothetical protein